MADQQPESLRDPVSLREAAKRVGVSPQRITELAKTDPTFPPKKKVGRSLAVSWPAFERWHKARNRKPGRRPKAQTDGDTTSHQEPPPTRRNGAF
jgi:hypothetical protein